MVIVLCIRETEEITNSWNKEDEAYILFFQQNYNDDFISPLSLCGTSHYCRNLMEKLYLF